MAAEKDDSQLQWRQRRRPDIALDTSEHASTMRTNNGHPEGRSHFSSSSSFAHSCQVASERAGGHRATSLNWTPDLNLPVMLPQISTGARYCAPVRKIQFLLDAKDLERCLIFDPQAQGADADINLILIGRTGSVRMHRFCVTATNREHNSCVDLTS